MTCYCFDGTSEAGKGHHGGTNVLRFADVLAEDHYYSGGVGNPIGFDGLGKIAGLAFGYGGQQILDAAIQECQSRIGDDPIVDVIGFSRGAAIAIEFVHRVKEWCQAENKPVTFRFVGIMDTVFSFGLPNDIDINYHHALPSDVPIKAVYHAVALNETRSWFQVTCQPALPNVADFKEIGFKGAHADIGGGYRDRRLSNIVLNWLIEGAINNGVQFNQHLPEGKAYAGVYRNIVPVEHEYYKSDPDRLPFRENQWFFPQAPRRIDRHVVEEAASRGLHLCDWYKRTVKDYRTKPRPKVTSYHVNLSPYLTQAGKIIDPVKNYKLYKKYRGNGRPMLLAEHEQLSVDDQIHFDQTPSLAMPHKKRFAKFRNV